MSIKRMNDNGESSPFGVIGAIVIIALILIVGGVVFYYGFGAYKVHTNEAGILTEFNGKKVAVTEVGWNNRWPIVTGFESFSLAEQNIYFPADYLELEKKFNGDTQTGAIGIDIKTTDDKVVDTGVVMPFRIIDVYQWSVVNQNPMEQFQKKFDALSYNYLQTQSSVMITSNITQTNKELCAVIKGSTIEKDFGVEVKCPELLRPTFTKKALDALSQKQATIAISEGELIAADNRADATRKLADAAKYQSDQLRGASDGFLKYSSAIELYKVLGDKDRKDVTTIVVPYGQDFVLPPTAK